MAESSTSSLLSKSSDLLATPSHERLELLLNQLATPEETLEFQSALALYDFCVSKFPNCLTLMLLKIYQSSSNEIVRFQSIHLLSSTLDVYRNRETHLSLDGLNEIKPLLIPCLKMKMEETHMKILRKIVSFIAYNVVSLDNDGWDELGDCILSLAETEPLKAFHVFVELPRVYLRFIDRFMQRIVEEAEKVLLNPKNEDDVENWSLGLETLVKMSVQILDHSDNDVEDWRLGLVKIFLSILVKSVKELVKKKGMEEFVVQGLENLERFLFRDRDCYGYNKDQCVFVSTFVYKIKELGTKIMEVAKKIHRLVTSSNNPPENQDFFDRFCFEQLNTLSLLEIGRIFAYAEERSKDMAIRRLNLLLSDDNPNKADIDVTVMRTLQKLIVSCLTKRGISESNFKVLGEVVFHVAYEMDEIRDYIVSNSRTKFQRAVYIYQCLTMPLDEEDFVIPVMEKLLPEISSRLNPPSEVLVDNSEWVLAFTGAFCGVIHLLDTDNQAESVKEIAYKMIDSVRELVERGMEVGLVRRAFRDVESIVMKDVEWFGSSEYKFVKGMLWRLYAIKGMKMESKLVLWRINIRLEGGLTELFKQLLESELNWLDQWRMV
ncbi:unnamed protein product [Arabis nemorensis]|uniref:DUF577 domain-containing protein n=1 Tax=Arabis nemorensis TaxID=586526 RepID=A0A565AY05_9BRAS|nr:unnamed protein product [Arabis nemorensis]